MIEEKGGSTEVLERLMSSYGVSTQKNLAEALGIPANNISGWTQRDSVPGNAIIKCALDTGTDLQWLVTGKLANANSPRDQDEVSGKALYEKILSSGGKAVLRRILDSYGFKTQKELGDLLSISSGTISTWVRRDYFPGDVVVTCALDTGVSLSWLATGRGEPSKEKILSTSLAEHIPKYRFESGLLKEAGRWTVDNTLFNSPTSAAEYIEGVKYSWLIDRSQSEIGGGRWFVSIDGTYDVFDVSRLPGSRLRLTNSAISYECSLGDVEPYGAVLFTLEKHI